MAAGERFLKGIGISTWQNSVDDASQWTAHLKKQDYFGQQRHVQAFLRRARPLLPRLPTRAPPPITGALSDLRKLAAAWSGEGWIARAARPRPRPPPRPPPTSDALPSKRPRPRCSIQVLRLLGALRGGHRAGGAAGHQRLPLLLRVGALPAARARHAAGAGGRRQVRGGEAFGAHLTPAASQSTLNPITPPQTPLKPKGTTRFSTRCSGAAWSRW